MSGSRPVAVGREDSHFAKLPHRLRESEKSGRLHAVVVGYKDVHDVISNFGFQMSLRGAAERRRSNLQLNGRILSMSVRRLRGDCSWRLGATRNDIDDYNPPV